MEAVIKMPNHRPALDATVALSLAFGAYWRRAGEIGR
jgi:hypothetical protein